MSIRTYGRTLENFPCVTNKQVNKQKGFFGDIMKKNFLLFNALSLYGDFGESRGVSRWGLSTTLNRSEKKPITPRGPPDTDSLGDVSGEIRTHEVREGHWSAVIDPSKIVDCRVSFFPFKE